MAGCRSRAPVFTSWGGRRLPSQQVDDIRSDDVQGTVWLHAKVADSGASCHAGYRSCCYRSVDIGRRSGGPARLVFTESRKSSDPKDVYGDAPNLTQL